jgi:hypothetical protein
VGTGRFYLSKRRQAGSLSYKLLTSVVFDDESLPNRVQSSELQIKVRAREHFLAAISLHPVDNLRRVLPEKVTVITVEHLAILAREEPYMLEIAVSYVLQIPFEFGCRRWLGPGLRGRPFCSRGGRIATSLASR